MAWEQGELPAGSEAETARQSLATLGGNQAVRSAAAAKDPVDVFVGGFGDEHMGPVRTYFSRYKNANPGAQYFSWGQPGAIRQFIESLTADTPVNLIGHSLGGQTAAQVAAALNRRINMLITADPVGDGDPGDFRGNVGQWINIKAAPSRSNLSDLAAFVGNPGANLPEQQANSGYSIDVNHENFPAMMDRAPPEMSSPSDILRAGRVMSVPDSMVNPFP